MMNFIGFDKFVWFLGVVENRDDPLKLGRNQIRIFGLHTDDESQLPRDDLPWAVPIMPINSASYSGVGSSPTGIVEGSLIVGFFLDGDECQLPAIFGTVPVHPLDAENDPDEETAQQSSGEGGDSGYQSENESSSPGSKPKSQSPKKKVKTSTAQNYNPKPVDREVLNKSIDGNYQVGNLSEDETKSLMHQMKQRESSGNYRAENQFGYIGGYQMGGAALADLGYVDRSKCTSNSCLNDPSVWTGKDGINSKEDFLSNPSAQDSAMQQNLAMNHNRLSKMGVISGSDGKDRVGGLLATSHLLGAGGARKYAQGADGKDGNGVSGSHYYQIGSKAVTNIS